jgi:hypothetical protein
MFKIKFKLQQYSNKHKKFILENHDAHDQF